VADLVELILRKAGRMCHNGELTVLELSTYLTGDRGQQVHCLHESLDITLCASLPQLLYEPYYDSMHMIPSITSHMIPLYT
jgi:hypothetical protein